MTEETKKAWQLFKKTGYSIQVISCMKNINLYLKKVQDEMLKEIFNLAKTAILGDVKSGDMFENNVEFETEEGGKPISEIEDINKIVCSENKNKELKFKIEQYLHSIRVGERRL